MTPLLPDLRSLPARLRILTPELRRAAILRLEVLSALGASTVPMGGFTASRFALLSAARPAPGTWTAGALMTLLVVIGVVWWARRRAEEHRGDDHDYPRSPIGLGAALMRPRTFGAFIVTSAVGVATVPGHGPLHDALNTASSLVAGLPILYAAALSTATHLPRRPRKRAAAPQTRRTRAPAGTG